MVKSDGWLEELLQIVRIEGIDRKSGALAREKAIQGWLDYWIIEKEVKQSVIKMNFSSEEMDFIKYHTAEKLAEELVEDCLVMDKDNKELSVRIRCIKRK